MTEIVLIRHGETDWNAEKRLQGYLDIPLNAKGEQQATALSQALLDEPLDAIIASDLQRAMQTAQAIAAPRGMTVMVDADLRERCYGAFEGVPYADIGLLYPEAYAAWQAREIDARYPPGVHIAETLREFSIRAISTIKRLATQHFHRKIAIVSHGGFLDCIYRSAQEIDMGQIRKIEILNASINRLAWNGSNMQVLQWGETGHLCSPALDEIYR